MLGTRLTVIFHPHLPSHVFTGLPQGWASSPFWPLAWQTAPCSFIGAWRPLTLPGPRRWNVGGPSAPLALQSLARKSSCCTHPLRAWAVPCPTLKGVHTVGVCSRSACSGVRVPVCVPGRALDLAAACVCNFPRDSECGWGNSEIVLCQMV